jgi:hypothetical protein
MSVCKSTSYSRNSVQNAADLEWTATDLAMPECAENFSSASSRPTTVATTPTTLHRQHSAPRLKIKIDSPNFL